MEGPRTVRVEVEIPTHLQDELDQLLVELMAGRRPRMEALSSDRRTVEQRASSALAKTVAHIEQHDGTGGARRLVKFIAGLYNGDDYPFDLTELRGLDVELQNACLDCLNYDRLGIDEVHTHLPGGDKQLHRWLERYSITPQTRP